MIDANYVSSQGNICNITEASIYFLQFSNGLPCFETKLYHVGS